MSVTLARNQRLVKDLETWIREATTEAAITTKGVVPDDPDYFDYIKKHDQSEKRNRQDHDKWEKDQEEDSVDLSPYKNGLAPQERLIRIAYPAGVEYAAKMDVGYRNYQKVKKMLAKWLLLFPFDPNKLTYVMTDSSDHGQGGVLLQEYNGRLRAFAVHSKKWPSWQKEIPGHVKEGMALVSTLKRFEYMLRQTKLKILTDSQNARDLLTRSKPTMSPARWIRWRCYVQSTFRAEVIHVDKRLNLERIYSADRLQMCQTRRRSRQSQL